MKHETISSSLSDRMITIIKKMFKDENYIPTEAAFHLAVITTMLGWNRTLGHKDDPSLYADQLNQDWPEYRKYLNDFKKGDFHSLIQPAEQLKKELYPLDLRLIAAAGYVDGKLRAEYAIESSVN